MIHDKSNILVLYYIIANVNTIYMYLSTITYSVSFWAASCPNCAKKQKTRRHKIKILTTLYRIHYTHLNVCDIVLCLVAELCSNIDFFL